MKTIHYPIFLGARDYTNDLFWKKVFENLAYGETPRGVYFQKNNKGECECLYSLTKKKEFNYNFSNMNSEQTFNDLYLIFTKTLGIKSKSDLSRKREVFEQFQQSNARKTEDLWSKIKRKSLKENLIHDFILKNKKKYFLEEINVRKLHFYISVGLVFKIFNPSDIKMSEGSIEEITGIYFDVDEVKIDKCFSEPRVKKNNEAGMVSLADLWANYVKTL